jgi:hypothetical protein
MLTYKIGVNAIDEYFWLANSTTMECMKLFLNVVAIS